MAGRLVDIVLGAAEDNVEWTVCRRLETTDASTQTSKEGGSELRSIVYKMVHGSTTFQLLEEHGDAFVMNYANIMSLASKMRLNAYQHMKLKIDKEKELRAQRQKEQKDQKQNDQKIKKIKKTKKIKKIKRIKETLKIKKIKETLKIKKIKEKNNEWMKKKD